MYNLEISNKIKIDNLFYNFLEIFFKIKFNNLDLIYLLLIFF